MPFVLMVFLAVACLPAWTEPPGWVHSAVLSAALTWLGVAATAFEAFWTACVVRKALGATPPAVSACRRGTSGGGSPGNSF